MVLWRCFLSIMILLLIMFPPSWISSNFIAKAGESHHLSHHIRLDKSCSTVKESTAKMTTVEAKCLAVNGSELPSQDRSQSSENWLDFVSRKLRGLLWGVTRGIQHHPIKSWLAELEINSPSRNEEVVVEVEPNVIV